MNGLQDDSASASASDDDPVDRLQRWEAFDAVWRVLGRSGAGATVALLRCDAGEEVSRFTSDDPGLLAFLDARAVADRTSPGDEKAAGQRC